MKSILTSEEDDEIGKELLKMTNKVIKERQAELASLKYEHTKIEGYTFQFQTFRDYDDRITVL